MVALYQVLHGFCLLVPLAHFYHTLHFLLLSFGDSLGTKRCNDIGLTLPTGDECKGLLENYLQECRNSPADNDMRLLLAILYSPWSDGKLWLKWLNWEVAVSKHESAVGFVLKLIDHLIVTKRKSRWCGQYPNKHYPSIRNLVSLLLVEGTWQVVRLGLQRIDTFDNRH